MAVYDRWHRDPQPGDEPCEHSRGRRKLYPGADHLKGRRWQVQWEDPNSPGRKRPKRSFDLRDGTDPNVHADAFDKLIQAQLVTRTYVNPRAGEVTLQAYAEQWRNGRKLDVNPAQLLDGRLRNHVYEDPARPRSGRTPKGGISIGQHPMALLAQRPSLVSDWIEAMPLAAGSAGLVVGDVSVIFGVAADDGVVIRNPFDARSVGRPSAGRTLARPWSLEQVLAMETELPGRWKVIPRLGAGTGMRQGEMFGLGVADVDWLGKDPEIRVERALKVIGTELRFGPLKNRKPHTVPLAASVKERLQRHLYDFPAVDVTLPWHDPKDKERHGKPFTVRLLVTTAAGGAASRRPFDDVWRNARRRAKITPPGARERDDGCHALRHTAASTWLRNGVDIVRVAAWIGDTVQTVADTYAHLMPGRRDDDGRAAVDGFFTPCAPDVPSKAAGGESAQADGG
jgi:integrase